jgi:hypothetical protein
VQVKLFEIRDRHTFIPVMATRLFIEGDPIQHDADIFLLRRAGYSREQILFPNVEPYIILCKLDGVEAHYDPWSWQPARTLTAAHNYIIANWQNLKSGDVIDVEFILGEVDKPKRSERFS